MHRPNEQMKTVLASTKIELRPKIMYPISYKESGLSGTISLVNRYKLLEACVTNITRHYRKSDKGAPRLYIARGRLTTPPPTQVLSMASAP